MDDDLCLALPTHRRGQGAGRLPNGPDSHVQGHATDDERGRTGLDIIARPCLW